MKSAENVDVTRSGALFSIAQVDERTGRGMVAARFVPAQTYILQCAPDVVVLYSSHAGKLCATCFAPVQPGMHGSFLCHTCDQFVLCAHCAQGDCMGNGMAAEEQTCTRPSSCIRVHQLVCAWYNELPASVRAPGQDTDFVRFCLLYGARVALGDTRLRRAIHTLNDYRKVQSRDFTSFCEVFARDKIVATFGPTQPKATTASVTSNETADEARTAVQSSLANDKATLHGTGAAHSSSMQTPRYPVSAEELFGVLMRTGCNSFGFPFNQEETIGWALHETFCLVNHSCVPNAAVVVVDEDEGAAALAQSGSREDTERRPRAHAPRRGWMGLKAIRDIDPNEEITISYVDLQTYGGSVRDRQRYLLERYRFLCRCPMCEQQKKHMTKGKVAR